jgi:hypothetical protein
LLCRGSPPESAREALFISHASPEDNAFTLWLDAKLTALGYEVFAAGVPMPQELMVQLDRLAVEMGVAPVQSGEVGIAPSTLINPQPRG